MVNWANMAKSSSESPSFTIHYSLFTDRRSGIRLRDDELIKRDERDLHRFGYAQELFRTMGGFSNFAISFSIISILTGAVTLYGDGLAKGGPAEMAFGWPLVALFTLAVTASMAELSSAFPTSGGMYHWAAMLGGPGWGWFTAWINIAGLVATIAGVDYGCAQFVTPLVGLSSSTRTVLLVYALILISHALINHYGIRLVAWLNDFSVTVHIAGECRDRKSTRLNSSHSQISYAVFCLKKKNN